MVDEQKPPYSYIRSATAPEEELVVACEVTECKSRFRTLMGMRTHLKRVHNISHKGRKINPAETICSSCGKDFGTNKKLVSHGSAEVCAKRKKICWEQLTCQNPNCGKTFEKFLGSNKTRNGGKFCTPYCSNHQPRTCSECQISFLGPGHSKYCKEHQSPTNRKKPQKSKPPVKPKPRSRNGKLQSKPKSTTTKPIKRYPTRNVCHYCNTEFISLHKRKGCFTCVPKAGGPRPGGGRSKQLDFTSRHGEEMKLNKEEILMGKYLDTLPVKWTRNWKGFPYVSLSGKNRNFYPDFYIPAYDLYVEYKGWITDDMAHKMQHAQEVNPNLNLCIVVGRRRDIQSHGLHLADLQKGTASLPLNLLV